MITYTLAVVDHDGGLPTPGRIVRVCSKSDADCTTPFSNSSIPDADRQVSVQVPSNLNLFLRFLAPDRLPVDLYLHGVLFADRTGEDVS
ncbi:MAG TPA: hypothetical protein VG963_26690, partial [Polyangiaceae bacterium]|nr:hypothetical protein [Polyangiaceae bacterium]